MQWSPLGTYLATIHRQGAAVWGGEKSFNRLMRYIHPQVCCMMLFLLLFLNLCSHPINPMDMGTELCISHMCRALKLSSDRKMYVYVNIGVCLALS